MGRSFIRGGRQNPEPGRPARRPDDRVPPVPRTEALRAETFRACGAKTARKCRGPLGNRAPAHPSPSTRFPATFELISAALLLIFLASMLIGLVTARRRQGPLTRLINRVTFLYGLVAGALPDFWIGLMFVFFLYFVFRIAPAPVGQISSAAEPPLVRPLSPWERDRVRALRWGRGAA